MKIKLKKTIKASDDGIHIKVYEKDKTYEVSEKLGKGLIKAEKAEEVKGNSKPEEPKADPLKGSPANMDKARDMEMKASKKKAKSEKKK